MGLFEQIRSRSLLLIIAIGGALGAFMMTDLDLRSFTQRDPNVVGSINGEDIEYNKFLEQMDRLGLISQQYEQMSRPQLAEVIWNQEMNRIVIGELIDDLGFRVEEDELWWSILNNQSIAQMSQFRDPATGAFMENEFKTQLRVMRDQAEAGTTPEAVQQWNDWTEFVNGVRMDRLNTKFFNAVTSGLSWPASLYNYDQARLGQQASVDIAVLAANSIEDSVVTVEESDYKAVYNEMKETFKLNGELRDIMFASFDIIPSEVDHAAVLTSLNELIPELTTSEDDSVFVLANSERGFDDIYTTWEGAPKHLADLLDGQSVGQVVGPVAFQNGYELAKVMDVRNLPDSVNAKHILISYQGAQAQSDRDPQLAFAMADSIYKGLLDGTLDFDQVNSQVNDDLVAAADGGSLGWFSPGQMVPSFEKFCFRNNEGDYGFVSTQFGFHIVKIVDHKGSVPSVRFARVYREVFESQATRSEIFSRAASFMNALDLDATAYAAATEAGATLLPHKNMAAMDDQITGLGESREVVRWAFDENREIGDVDVIENGMKQYVVVRLTHVYSDDYKSLDDVRDEIQMMAMQRAKVRHLEGQMGEDAATESMTLTLNSPFIAGSGRDGRVIGQIVGSAQGYASGIVSGEAGVYRYTVTAIVPGFSEGTPDAVASQNNRLRNNAQSFLFQALLDRADVEDFRGRMF